MKPPHMHALGSSLFCPATSSLPCTLSLAGTEPLWPSGKDAPCPWGLRECPGFPAPWKGLAHGLWWAEAVGSGAAAPLQLLL